MIDIRSPTSRRLYYAIKKKENQNKKLGYCNKCKSTDCKCQSKLTEFKHHDFMDYQGEKNQRIAMIIREQDRRSHPKYCKNCDSILCVCQSLLTDFKEVNWNEIKNKKRIF